MTGTQDTTPRPGRKREAVTKLADDTYMLFDPEDGQAWIESDLALPLDAMI